MILFDALPIGNAHRRRGIGFYVSGVLRALQMASELRPKHEAIIALCLAHHSVPWPSHQQMTWRPQKPAVRLSWLINRCAVGIDFRRTTQATLYHATDPNNLCRPRRLPMLATAYDLVPLRFPEQYLAHAPRDVRWGYRTMLRRYQSADHLVAISQSTRDDFANLLGIAKDKISVIYPSIDAAEIAGRFQHIGNPSPRLPAKFFFYVGAIEPRKNVPDMLTAFAGIAGDVPEQFLLAGHTSPDERKHIDALAAQLGISHRVVQLGMVSNAELGQLYANATALVFMSRYEGFGLPVLEAMATGCPVISSDAGALGEIAPGAAYMVPLDDVEALGVALATLSADVKLRHTLSVQGLQRATDFDMSTAGHAFYKLYDQLRTA